MESESESEREDEREDEDGELKWDTSEYCALKRRIESMTAHVPYNFPRTGPRSDQAMLRYIADQTLKMQKLWRPDT